MISRDPKKVASGVLAKAFGGVVSRGGKSNYPDPKGGKQGKASLSAHSGAGSNFGSPSFGDQEDPSFPHEAMQMAEGGEVDEGKIMAASELLEALETKDASALAAALQSFVEQCQYVANEMEDVE